MKKLFLLIFSFLLLLGCSTGDNDVLYAPPEEAEIMDHNVKTEYSSDKHAVYICPTNPVIEFIFSYRNPNSDVTGLTMDVYDGNTGEFIFQKWVPIDCKDCDIVSVTLADFANNYNKAWQVNVWLTTPDYKSVVYTFDLFMKVYCGKI